MKIPQIEISIKFKGALKSELKKINSSKDLYQVCKSMYDNGTFDWQEEMILICLSQSNKIIGYYKISSGGITGTICDPKVVFTVALNCAGTTQIILTHNHPSGNLMPSQADNVLTDKIKNAGSFLDIRLVDHLIITDEGYYSYADEGKL